MKVILYMAVSSDGFIAGPNDETPWSEEEWTQYSTFVRSKGSLIIGRRTYELMKDEEMERVGNPLTVILSTTMSKRPNDRIYVARTPQDAVAIVQEHGFSEVVLGGGALANSAFLEAGLIDEAILDVEQVALGHGARLFYHKEQETRLVLSEERMITPRLIQKHYHVV